MVAVRITRPEDINPTPVGRDAGAPTATGAQFGAKAYEAAAELGATFGAIGNHLMAKAQDSSDKVGASAYSLEYSPAAQKVINDARTEFPDGGEQYAKRVSEGLDQAHSSTIGAIQQRGIRLSPKAIEGLGIQHTGNKTRFMTEAVTVAHNAQIAKLQDAQQKNFEGLRGRVLSGEVDVDTGVAEVDRLVTDSGQLWGSADLRKKAQEWKSGVVDTAIASLEQAGREDVARSIRDRFYGTVPTRGAVTDASRIDTVVDRIIGVESSGDPNAKNPKSTATGLGQFTEGTWLSTIKNHRPDLYNSMSPAELLALRTNPVIAREMTVRHTEDNAKVLGGRGIAVTPANLYLAHFLGAAGAVSVLSANPSTPITDELVGQKGAVAANRTILEGKTAGDVVAWAGSKMEGAGGRSATAAAMPNADKALYWEQKLTQSQTRRQTQTEVAQVERYERQIIDAGAGKAPLPSRADIESDPVISEPRRNALLRQYDAAAGDAAKLQGALAKFADPNGGPFNPFDTDERKMVDRIYTALGGNMNALKAVVDRTGVAPASAVRDLRAALVSNDPGRVGTALQIASNLISGNPNVLANAEGRSDIENAAIGFRHQIEHFGLTAEQAAQRFIKEQTPEYKAQVKARLKSEDVDAVIRKQAENGTLDSELRSAFSEWYQILGGRPAVEFNPAARSIARSDYAELVKEKYLEHGDMSRAKAQAQAQMKKVWGVTSVNGSATVVRFPPENAPAYAGIPDVSQRIAEQAIADIKEQTGQDVDRGKLMIAPVMGGQTAQAYTAGRAPPYMISWIDKNGTLQTLSPGKAFVADPDRMRAAISDQRRTDLDRARQGADSVILGSSDLSLTPAERERKRELLAAPVERETGRDERMTSQRGTIDANREAFDTAAQRQGARSIQRPLEAVTGAALSVAEQRKRAQENRRQAIEERKKR
jgi:hypothetical protein